MRERRPRAQQEFWAAVDGELGRAPRNGYWAAISDAAEPAGPVPQISGREALARRRRILPSLQATGSRHSSHPARDPLGGAPRDGKRARALGMARGIDEATLRAARRSAFVRR